MSVLQRKQPVKCLEAVSWQLNSHADLRPHTGERRSAVEMLQATKAFYVKSQSVRDCCHMMRLDSSSLQVSPPSQHSQVWPHSPASSAVIQQQQSRAVSTTVNLPPEGFGHQMATSQTPEHVASHVASTVVVSDVGSSVAAVNGSLQSPCPSRSSLRQSPSKAADLRSSPALTSFSPLSSVQSRLRRLLSAAMSDEPKYDGREHHKSLPDVHSPGVRRAAAPVEDCADSSLAATRLSTITSGFSQRGPACVGRGGDGSFNHTDDRNEALCGHNISSRLRTDARRQTLYRSNTWRGHRDQTGPSAAELSRDMLHPHLSSLQHSSPVVERTRGHQQLTNAVTSTALLNGAQISAAHLPNNQPDVIGVWRDHNICDSLVDNQCTHRISPPSPAPAEPATQPPPLPARPVARSKSDSSGRARHVNQLPQYWSSPPPVVERHTRPLLPTSVDRASTSVSRRQSVLAQRRPSHTLSFSTPLLHGASCEGVAPLPRRPVVPRILFDESRMLLGGASVEDSRPLRPRCSASASPADSGTSAVALAMDSGGGRTSSDQSPPMAPRSGSSGRRPSWLSDGSSSPAAGKLHCSRNYAPGPTAPTDTVDAVSSALHFHHHNHRHQHRHGVTAAGSTKWSYLPAIPPLNSETLASLAVEPSVVEKNARVVKWLVHCRRSQDVGAQLADRV